MIFNTKRSSYDQYVGFGNIILIRIEKGVISTNEWKCRYKPIITTNSISGVLSANYTKGLADTLIDVRFVNSSLSVMLLYCHYKLMTLASVAIIPASLGVVPLDSFGK